jgi:hypothetical protein
VGFHGSLSWTFSVATELEGWRGGIPHLAKNERDMGHPEIRGRDRKEFVGELPNPSHPILFIRTWFVVLKFYNKFVIPERTRIPVTLRQRNPRAAFIKESRMKLANATKLDRNSG